MRGLIRTQYRLQVWTSSCIVSRRQRFESRRIQTINQSTNQSWASRVTALQIRWTVAGNSRNIASFDGETSTEITRVVVVELHGSLEAGQNKYEEYMGYGATIGRKRADYDRLFRMATTTAAAAALC